MNLKEQRKYWWIILYVIQSFNISLQACRLLLKLGDQYSTYYPSLIILVNGYYGRPLKKQKGVSKNRQWIEESVI